MNDLHGRLYFRTRENGAAVFRVDTQNKSRRLELEPIASVAIKKAEYRVHGDAVISDAEDKAIRNWIASRLDTLKSNDERRLIDLIEDLKSTTHWIVSQASPEDLDPHMEELLLALHDMRSTIVRKKAENLK